MTNPTPNELDAAIGAFTMAERSFAELIVQAEALLTARKQLDETTTSIAELRTLLADAVNEEAKLAAQLSRLTSSLNDAVEVVKRTDPKVISDSIERLTGDFDSQKQRVSELAGELRARIDESTSKTDHRIGESEANTNTRFELLHRQLRTGTRATVAVGLVICILQFAILATR